MARIAGVDIPREKRLGTALTYIYGIGDTAAAKVCDGTEIDGDTRVRDLTDEEVTRLRTWIDANLKVEGDLRRDVSQDTTVGVYRCTASAPTPTPAPARAPRRPSPARRRSGSTSRASPQRCRRACSLPAALDKGTMHITPHLPAVARRGSAERTTSDRP
jgi:small subunit ribosomal protein S13